MWQDNCQSPAYLLATSTVPGNTFWEILNYSNTDSKNQPNEKNHGLNWGSSGPGLFYSKQKAVCSLVKQVARRCCWLEFQRLLALTGLSLQSSNFGLLLGSQCLMDLGGDNVGIVLSKWKAPWVTLSHSLKKVGFPPFTPAGQGLG